MPHPTDALLNEYLDETLAPTQAAALAQHLAACPACAGRWAALRAVFTSLDALPEVPLPVDLAVRVVAQLPASQPLPPAALPRFVQWFAALQVAGVCAGLVFSWPFIEAALNINVSLPGLPWDVWLTSFLALGATGLAPWLTAPVGLPAFDPFLAALAAGSVAALWLVGNGLLLRPFSRK